MDPAEVERAVGLIDGIIQEDAFKAMLDDFAAKNHEVFDPTADPLPVVRVERDVERLDDPQRDQDGDVLPEAVRAVSVD